MNPKAITMAFKLGGYTALYDYMNEYRTDNNVIKTCSEFFDIKIEKINIDCSKIENEFDYDTINLVLGGAMYNNLNYFFINLCKGTNVKKDIVLQIYYKCDWDCDEFRKFFWNNEYYHIIPYAIIRKQLLSILDFCKFHNTFDTNKLKYISFNYGKFEFENKSKKDSQLILTMDQFNDPDLDLLYLNLY